MLVLITMDVGLICTLKVDPWKFLTSLASTRRFCDIVSAQLRIWLPFGRRSALKTYFCRPSPNHLRIEVYGMRMSRIRLLLNNASFSGFIYDYVIDYLRPYVETKVAQLLARELRNFAVKAFKTVRVYTASSEDEDIFAEESVLSRTWTKALGSAASYLALIRGQHPGGSRSGGSDEDVAPRRPLPERQRRPRSAEVERERGVFDGCLRTLTLSRGFDPVSLPQDIGDLNFSFGRLAVYEGNLTGLSSVYRSGDCALVLGECGLAVRLNLGFEDLLVRAAAAVYERSRTRTAMLDVHIPAVELALDIAEINNQLRIISYHMEFMGPVKVTAPSIARDGSVNIVSVSPEVVLSEQDLEELKSAVHNSLQQFLPTAESFISDPLLLEP
ncbi:uncharacterized protein LOC119441579 isoform X3 [Dermacentor silvarum]|uniref:uncharacterized protein LOC119441579 isoform X3 n=1 Tax=Dermacentor silvarum TaxID=543639 RepID=UPI0018995C40|nr:uncharacterized protein LOC119441579 isoform X3 [Dermacentor silvarum]